MSNYLLTARSLTYAQKSVRILTRAGVTAILLRTPKEIAAEGCGYSVKISEKYLHRSLEALSAAGFSPKSVYRILENGGYERVII